MQPTTDGLWWQYWGGLSVVSSSSQYSQGINTPPNHYQNDYKATNPNQKDSLSSNLASVIMKLFTVLLLSLVGFSAAMLPFLQDDEARSVQRQRVADNYPGADAYYSAVLTLFGQGWDQHRFRFTASGELQPDWNQECASSH